MKKLNNKGFGLAAALIVVVVFGVVVWMVLREQSNNKPVSQTVNQITTSQSQKKSRDASKKNDISYINDELARYYSENNYYPSNLGQIQQVSSKVDIESGDYKYIPGPHGCEKCKSFTVEATLEDGTKYIKTSSE